MARATRRPVTKQGAKLSAPPAAAEVAPGPSTAPVAPAIEPVSPAPETAPPPAAAEVAAGTLDNYEEGTWTPITDDKPGGAASPIVSTVREKTLNELNLEARATDRVHAEARAAAEAKVKDVIEPMLAGVQRPRIRHRRMQKNLRPQVAV